MCLIGAVGRHGGRQRCAGIGYVVCVQPNWSDNTHRFELLILPAGSAHAWRPSVAWVEQELRRTRHPLAKVVQVQADPQGYAVTLRLSGGVQAQVVAQRIRSLIGVSSRFIEG